MYYLYKNDRFVFQKIFGLSYQKLFFLTTALFGERRQMWLFTRLLSTGTANKGKFVHEYFVLVIEYKI